MEILIVVVQILELILFTLLAISAGYFLLFSILGLFYSDKKGKNNPKRSIAIFLPAYKEDTVILDVVHSALEQDYPSDRFQVIVIADSFRNSTLKALKKLPIKLIEVHFKKSTKAKALNKAIQNTQKSFDIAVVLDADNIMQKNYLQEVNKHFVPNAIIQTHRTAKNQNTPFAILDAISEEINNHVFRKGQLTIGLSAALIGSGMVFDYPLLKNLMTNITAIGGFDKELEVAILKRRYTIQYLDNVLVYDEKVQKAEVFKGQRRRWLSAQFIYLFRAFPTALFQLLRYGNIDLFNKIIQFALIPRILLLGLLVIVHLLVLLAYIVGMRTQLATGLFMDLEAWTGLLCLTLIAFALSVPLKFYNRKTLGAMASLPKAFLLMTGSLLRLRGANKSFIHTAHGNQNSNG